MPTNMLFKLDGGPLSTQIPDKLYCFPLSCKLYAPTYAYPP